MGSHKDASFVESVEGDFPLGDAHEGNVQGHAGRCQGAVRAGGLCLKNKRGTNSGCRR